MPSFEETKTTALSAAPILVLAGVAAAIYFATVSLSGTKPMSMGETSVGKDIEDLPIPPGVVRSPSRCTGKTLGDRVWYTCAYDTKEPPESILKFYSLVLSFRGWTAFRQGTVYCRGEHMIEFQLPADGKSASPAGMQITYAATSTLFLTADAKRNACL